MLKNLNDKHNAVRLDLSPSRFEFEEHEQWHTPPALIEELPKGLISDEI